MPNRRTTLCYYPDPRRTHLLYSRPRITNKVPLVSIAHICMHTKRRTPARRPGCGKIPRQVTAEAGIEDTLLLPKIAAATISMTMVGDRRMDLDLAGVQLRYFLAEPEILHEQPRSGRPDQSSR
jgi:hypothetical protein